MTSHNPQQSERSESNNSHEDPKSTPLGSPPQRPSAYPGPPSEPSPARPRARSSLPPQRAHHLLAIDTSDFLRRAWHACEADGKPHQAAPTTLRTLARLLRGRQPTFALFAGESTTSFRASLYPSYKANRLQKPEGLLACEAYVGAALAGAGTPLTIVAGLEADDVIAGAVVAMRGEFPIVVAGHDKDLEQLVDDQNGVMVWDGAERVRDEAAVLERRGVLPHRLVELFALAGDEGDNIPNVPNWREKTAAKILQGLPRRRLEDLVKDGGHWWVPERYRQAFVSHREQILLAMELVRLRGNQAARHIRVDELGINPLDVAESLRASADRWRGGEA